MIALTMSFALILTILLSLAIGVGAGYYAIVAILHAFNPHREEKRVATGLVPTIQS